MSKVLSAVIRHATVDDLLGINTIYNREVERGVATWDYEPWSQKRRKEWFEIRLASEPVLVADREGEVAGFAYLSLYRSKPGYLFTRENTVYIGDDFQKMGIGKALLKELIKQAHTNNIRCVIAAIESSNEACIKLHQNLGFELVGKMSQVGYKFGRWLDLVNMELLMPKVDFS
jgi:L-amino acid N-acyltransferase